MKKPLLIGLGVVIVLGVLGAWIYLLFFGAPQNSDEIFANFGFNRNTPVVQEPISLPPPEEEFTPAPPPKPKPLRQLTTKAVAGFTFMSSSSPTIRFAERGLGHIYELNLQTGEETRLSGTTIPLTKTAIFSPAANQVILTAIDGYEVTSMLGTINTNDNSLELIELPSESENFSFTSAKTLNYSISTPEGTEGYALNLSSNESTRLFSIPLNSVDVLWGESLYVIPKMSNMLLGSVYNISNGHLKAVTDTSLGLVSGLFGGDIVVSNIMNGIRVGELVTLEGKKRLALPYTPEKCAVKPEVNQIWCISSIPMNQEGFLDDWRKGIVQSEDLVWNLSTITGEAVLKLDLFAEAGRIIDAETVLVDNSNTYLLFSNRTDNTLWLYDSSIQ